jgi:hypothetical protein
MTPFETIVGLVSLSNGLISIKRWLQSQRGEEHVNGKQLLQQLNQEQQNTTPSPDTTDAIRSAGDTIIDVLDGRIKRARRKLEERLDDPFLPRERAGIIVDQADDEICWALELIRRYNHGTLPSKELQDLWGKHGCK